jgi:carboxyl-terminal processing protease
MISRERIWLLVSCVLAAVLVLQSLGLPEVSARQKEDTNLFKELKVFTDVLAIVQRDYVRDIDSKQLVEGAIKGMLSTLDPHSGYLDPDFYQDLQVQTKGEFGGLGIEITIRDGLLLVVAPMEGSPAEKVGIRAGDAIVKIEGKFTKEYSLVDAIKRLRGPKGSPITISVYRKGSADLVDYTIVRDRITVRSVRARLLKDGFGYVRLSQFVETTSDDLRTALTALAEKSPNNELKGLILDLRNNPGGLLTQAILVGDLFLNEGVIVYTDGRDKKEQQKFFAHSKGTQPNYPIVVLVNEGSASAAEIIAGAFKDHGRALVVGSRTFGKGSVQTITPLGNGGAVTLTTALYYTKSGNSIQAQGVTPDIIIEDEDPEAKEEEKQSSKRVPLRLREGDLPGAIENPSNGRPGSKLEDNGEGSTRKRRESRRKQDAERVNSIESQGLGDGADSSKGEGVQTEARVPINIETASLEEIFASDRVLARAFEELLNFNVLDRATEKPVNGAAAAAS